MVEGCQSDWAPVKSGVPQGSILGPLLFILYVNNIPDDLSSPSVFFADDALIYNPCPPSSTSETAQESFDQVSDWCGSWLLKNNDDKGEAMKFTRTRNRAQCNYSIDIKPIAVIKYLLINILEWFSLMTCHANLTFFLLWHGQTDCWVYLNEPLGYTMRLCSRASEL